MKPSLEQRARLSQRLQQKLAPRMIQAMEILHLSSDDLDERIELELEKNVALERADDPALGGGRIMGPASATGAASTVSAPSAGTRERERERERQRSREERSPHRLSDDALAAREAMYAQAPDREASPVDRLHAQWALVECDPDEARLGSCLIDALDSHGFLADTDEALAASASADLARPVTPSEVGAIRALMTRELEPAGIAARDRRESLLTQLARVPSTRVDDALRADAIRLTSQALDDLERNRLPRLAQRFHLSVDRLQLIRDLVLSLDPAPLGQLNEEGARAVRPDAFIVFDADQDVYIVALSRGSRPALRISPEYERMATAEGTPEEARAMLKEGIRKARWFIDAIDQRATTLRRVLDEVVTMQREWLDKGPGFLKPMPMTEVAGRIGVAVSTVSRAVAGKWVATPHGVVEIRRFFAGGTLGPEGRPLAWDEVKRLVQEFVSSEDAHHPLSDAAIVKRLAEQGITLARRTVVKYREALGIPSSHLRRRHGGRA